MGRKERLPGHRAAAPWCGLNTVLLEDARDCGPAELEADVLEGSAEPSVAPARVLPGHRHQLRGGIAPFSAGALLRGVRAAVVLRGDQPPVPPQERFGVRERRGLLQQPAPDSLSLPREKPALGIRESKA